MRAKFQCNVVKKEPGLFEEVILRAVYANGTNSEDNQFSAATPTGELKMLITNKDAFGFFTPGCKYYLDITEAAE